MNADQLAILRDTVLSGDDDREIQIAWNRESLAEHVRTEQRLKAKFRLAEFLGDDGQMSQIAKDVEQIRAAIRFLQRTTSPTE